MEAMLGICLYSYPYAKLAKTLCLFYYCLCPVFNKIGEEGRTGSAWKKRGLEGEGGCGEGGGGQRGEMAQRMYAYMNKKVKKRCVILDIFRIHLQGIDDSPKNRFRGTESDYAFGYGCNM
jgi:hypothetical protein